uniref:Oxidation resistance protein 1-like n=1 Tax=Sinocyclocheilus grahami TaxID=75366 RepID=A0A672KNL5_SINGR
MFVKFRENQVVRSCLSALFLSIFNQITTKEEVNSKHMVKSDPEPESFRPSLNEPSVLLQPDQIEKASYSLFWVHIYMLTLSYLTLMHLIFWLALMGLSWHFHYLPVLFQLYNWLPEVLVFIIHLLEVTSKCPFCTVLIFWGLSLLTSGLGDNMFFIKGDMDSLSFGGGGGEFGLWLDGDLYHGRTHSCKTFGNQMLSKTEDFYVQDIEIWAFE